MKKTFLVIVIISYGILACPQEFVVPPFGTDSTFEIMTWNIEWFPKNGQSTIDYVTQIIKELNVDLLALQEIGDTVLFKQMLGGLDGYAGYFKSDWYGGLAYVFKKDVIKIDSAYEIYKTEPYWRAFPRSPLVIELTFMYEKFIVINNHLKCCGDGVLDPYDPWDEETRRLDACNLLEDYIRLNFTDEKVILLGDLNDELTDNPVDNVFITFINDADAYQFADMDIAEDNNADWSYPTWPSHIDHILITNDLFDEFSNEGSDIRTIAIDQYLDGGWYEYDENVSDHRPVAIKIETDANLDIDEFSQSTLVLYPNPVNDVLFLENLDNITKSITITDITGKILYETSLYPGKNKLEIGLLENGLYFITAFDKSNSRSYLFIKQAGY